MSDLDKLRTRVANLTHSVAKTVNEGFEEYRLGAGMWQVELATPEGPSTAGGAQALQALRLLPTRPGYATLVVGTVNGVLSTAELRTFDHVALTHEVRFRRPLEITSDEYADFLRKSEVVLNLCRIASKRVPPPPELVAEGKALANASRNARNLKLVGLAVALLVLGMVALRFLVS